MKNLEQNGVLQEALMIKIMKTRPDLFPSLFPRFRAMLEGG
jgi:hypothetical protein